MNDVDRWKRVQAVFTAALDLEPGARAALLDRECAMDEELRREVASLLVAHDRTGAVDRLALEVLSPAVDRVRSIPAVQHGQVVSHYVVLDRLGAGGMGVVYRARDERLDRSIALKFLSPDLVANRSAKQRFLLEARTAAALEHPNVCTIYEIGETPDGHLFIAMPLYDGETLMTRVARGPLPMDQAVWVAREIGSGLAAAHQHGIVHRDVKPSNVMLLPDGRLKILDFGVAKVKDSNLTATGTPIGTIAYMSPEQTRGEQVDQRADIWAVGVVLYEMLTGRRPFTGDTAAALMHAITTRPHAPASHLRERLPEELDDVIAMCLAKTPERRFATMQDVVAALDPTRPVSRTSRAADTRAADTITLDDGSAAPAAEKRRATVLVVTISDYASLLERLSPSDVDEAVGLVRTAAGDAVRRHGGLVNEAAEEEVVALFGIPATHEDDDVRAVKAALELHERIRAVARSASDRIGQSLVVQTGIDSGSLVVQRLREGPRRYSVSGAPAQIAARLASLAAPDTILIGPGCQRLVDPFVATEPARPIELGPNTPPIVPHRVVGESGVQTRLEASDRATLAPFTGRSAELSSLETAVREAATGAGRMVLVVGEAGMGKSRIIHELRERVRHTDARVLLGRCRSYGGVSPYLPIVEFLRDIIGAAHDEDGNQLAAKIRRIDSSLEPFLPLYLHLLSARSEAYPVPRHLQGEDLHAAMVDAVIAMVMTAARQSPLLLLLEDWHWADNASREVLQRLAEVVDSLPIAIIVATRPEPAVLAELGSLGTIVQLGALERSSTAILLAALLDADRISDALVGGVHDRTGGNPFFIEQVVHTLHEEGAIVTKGGETTLTRDIESLRLPDTVQAVIRARIDRLDGDSREVLRIASVIGREFGRTVLVAAVPRGIDTLRALERLRNAALVQQVHVVPEPVYRFKHVLTQEVAYGSLLAHQRQAAHGAIGHALEREAGHIDDLAETLAHHFGQAESWEAAVKYGTRAAERLSALSQYANALAMFERLHAWVSHLPDDAARRDAMADILLEQERLCETLGQRQRQQQIINELISLLAPHGASSRLAAAYVRQGDLLTLLKRFDAADRALSTVLRLSRDGADKQLERNALRSLGLLRWHQDRHREALSIAETTLEINRALGDELAAAGDLSNIGNILRGMGELDRARAVFEEALEMPALQRDPTLIPSIMHNLALVHRASGDLDLALDYLQRADDFRREKLLPLGRAIHLTTIAHIHLQQGDADKALQIYRQAVELSRRSRHAEGLAQSLRLLGELQFGLQQHNVEAVANLSEAATLFAQLEDHAAEVQAWTQVAAGHERLGDWAPARESWTEVRRLRQTLGDRKGELDALEGFARASRRDQEPTVAITAFEDALAMANALGEQAREAALHNTLGILEWERGRYLDALGHYESGLRLCRTIGDRTHEGLMLNSMGVTLARLQRHEEARTVLEESVALTRETGERLLEAHALTALGDVSLHLGRPETARECHDAAAVLRRTIDRNSTDSEKG